MTGKPSTLLHENPHDLITTTEAATIVGVSAATLRVWHNQNAGPRSMRIGGRILYRRADVHEWFARRAAATARGDDVSHIDGQLSVDDLDDSTVDD